MVAGVRVGAATTVFGVSNAYGMPVVAVIGDGQLARMMQTEAIELGVETRVLAAAREESAAQVFGDVRLGDYTDLADLRAIADGADAVTFDHEHVPNEYAQLLIDAGVSVEPRPDALLYAQDKLEQRRRLSEAGLPVPAFAAIGSVADAEAFWDETDGQVCLKATRGGYDGHGVWFPATREECARLVEDLLGRDLPLMAEKKVAFTRELSAMVARNRSGEVRAWPVVESRQDGGICRVAIAPAPGMSPELAQRCEELAVQVAEGLGVTGVLAVELFEYDGDNGPEVSVNELAMRPHNSGHWSMDGAVTGQFEQHVRAGMVLTGTEVKSLREGKASLVDGFAVFYRDELWLEQVHIPEYVQGTWTNHAPRRSRKLLLHRKEIDSIMGKVRDGHRTLVPLSLYLKDGRAKVELGLAQGKQDYDKRRDIKRRTEDREITRDLGRKLKGIKA